jgi:SAM-dependent methyltransferase
MTDAIRVFLSYTTTKAPDPRATGGAIARARDVLTARFGWRPVDAMDADILSVSGKVRGALLESDCIIADVTSSSPNVMFEVGFASALGYPVILLLNFEAFETERFREYFAVLGHNPARPVAADLGDLEYVTFPAATAPDAAWRAFEDELARRLERVREHFTPEVLLLRRSVRRFQAEVLEFMQRHRPSNPIVGFLAGRLHYSAAGLRAEGADVFLTLSQYYAEAMKAFAEADGDLAGVRALADLGQSAETIWTGRDDPLAVRIRERIFVVPTARFFDADEMERLAGLIQSQRQLHEVLVVQRERLADLAHPIEGGIGHDLLLMEPDVVGGYVLRPLGARDAPHLYVVRSADVHRRAERHYAAVRARAFPVRDVGSGADLVRAWLAHSQVGTWRAEWSAPVEHRPPGYFTGYDDNIRCWIPAYDEFIQQCADVVCHLLLERLRTTREPLRVLEIGCGTGALTEVLARWMEQLDAPHRKVGRPSAVQHLIAVDPASRMLRATRERLRRSFADRTPPFVSVESGRFPDSPPRAASALRYDVICGSLVLHDLLAPPSLVPAPPGRAVEEPHEAARRTLRKLARLLAPGGSLVFADILPEEHPARRARQLEAWRDWMREARGLSDDAVEAFLAANRDMAEAHSTEALYGVARACSADAVESTNEEARGAAAGLPFRVVSLTFPTPVV